MTTTLLRRGRFWYLGVAVVMFQNRLVENCHGFVTNQESFPWKRSTSSLGPLPFSSLDSSVFMASSSTTSPRTNTASTTRRRKHTNKGDSSLLPMTSRRTNTNTNPSPAIKARRPWKVTWGLLFGGLIILGLAMGSSTDNYNTNNAMMMTDPMIVGRASFPFGGTDGALVRTVVGATVPTSSTDLVAVALGEAIAGIIGATLSAILKALAALSNNNNNNNNNQQQQEQQQQSRQKPLVLAEALAESDYFVAQAGLAPTFQAVGISPLLASFGSVLVASIPSQLVKLSSKRKQRLGEEEESLQRLLLETQQQQQQKQRAWFFFQQQLQSVRRVQPSVPQRVVNPQDLRPVSDTQIDFVEVFSDVTRWLAYNGLKTDYGDMLVWSNGQFIGTGYAGAVLGMVAVFSSRLYADILYGNFRYGPVDKQREVQTRKTVDWVTYYTSSLVSSAALFGVYEVSQGPISRWIQGVLAGGFDGCVGSNSFQTCFDAYIDANSPGASPEAQFRALVTNLVMVGQRLQDVANDTSYDDIARLVRAWSVSAYSYLHSFY